MKRTNRLVILVGALLAVMAFVGVVVLLGNRAPTTQPKAQKTTVKVLVAVTDIAIGDSVTPGMADVREVDPKAVSGTAISDPSQLTGAPALIPIASGSQVNQEAFGRGPSGSQCISCQLKPGEKAIAFQVDPVNGLDFLITAGDHIDIVFRAVVVDAPLSATTFVKTILQDKRVLYVSATKITPVTNPTPSESPAPGGTVAAPPPASIMVIFAGTDADAEVIKFALTDNTAATSNGNNTIGSLMAVLRYTKDTDIEKTAGVTLKTLIDLYGIPLPKIIQPELASPAP